MGKVTLGESSEDEDGANFTSVFLFLGSSGEESEGEGELLLEVSEGEREESEGEGERLLEEESEE